MDALIRILLGYDGSDYADAAIDDLRWAGLAQEINFLVVSVGYALTAPTMSSHDITDSSATTLREASASPVNSAYEEAHNLASEAGRRVQASFPGWDVHVDALVGNPSQGLIEQVERWSADLVVVGSQGRSALGRFLLGSVSRRIATEARCSVRVARRIQKVDTALRILVGVDGSPGAERAVRGIASRFWHSETEVRITAVSDRMSPTRIAGMFPIAATRIAESNEQESQKARAMSEWAAEELRAAGLKASVQIKSGDPLPTLIEEAEIWGADSIFIGSHGLNQPDKKAGLGSVAMGLVTNAHCSVEVVR